MQKNIQQKNKENKDSRNKDSRERAEQAGTKQLLVSFLAGMFIILFMGGHMVWEEALKEKTEKADFTDFFQDKVQDNGNPTIGKAIMAAPATRQTSSLETRALPIIDYGTYTKYCHGSRDIEERYTAKPASPPQGLSLIHI